MPTNSPRAVFVTRESDYDLLLARHATREQARFFLETRGQAIAPIEERHRQLQDTLKLARLSVPLSKRRICGSSSTIRICGAWLTPDLPTGR